MSRSLIQCLSPFFAARIRQNHRLLASSYSSSSSSALQDASSPSPSPDAVHLTENCIQRMKELQASEGSTEGKHVPNAMNSRSNFSTQSVHAAKMETFLQVVMDNGIVQVTLSNPGGIVTGIRYGGIDNLLEFRNKETNRGYWDLMWSEVGGKGIFDVIEGTSFRVVVENEEQVELSFLRTWDPSLEGKFVPLNIDKRFILLRGSSGFYSYAIYEKLKEWPGFGIGETRFTFKLRKDKFQYL